MVMVTVNNDQFSMDGYLKTNLDLFRKIVEKKWDGVFYNSGYEGDGKTTLTAQVLYYLDPSFNLDRVVFTGEQFLKACDEANPFEAIQFDESYKTFTSTAMWNKTTQQIISKLTTIRRKQLYIGIIAPTFFNIHWYVAIHRSRFLLHTYADGMERGFFKFFNREKKEELYYEGKKRKNMNIVPPNFYGRFTNFSCLDLEAYENKKEASTKELQEQEENYNDDDTEQFRKVGWMEAIAYLNKNKLIVNGKTNGLPNREFIANKIDMSASQMHKTIKKLNITEETLSRIEKVAFQRANITTQLKTFEE